MLKAEVKLRPLVSKLNMPTVLKTAILPGESVERLFIATQVGEIFHLGNGIIKTFLDIRARIIKLGASRGGYDERGLLGLAFHPEFTYNGLFYLHYTLAGSQGPGALSTTFAPNPCNPETLNMKWINREAQYDHIDTVEEWIVQSNDHPQKLRTLLNIRRPFLNHNGVNSLNFSPETGKLVLTTGDGGSGFDPFNLSQNDMEIAGKIVEIDVNMNTFTDNPPIVTRFNELPLPIQEMLTVIAKGIRNIPGISFQKLNNQYVRYVGSVGQDLVESIFSFIQYKPMPVTQLIQESLLTSEPDREGFINFGWRGWEGAFPTSIIRSCSVNPALDEETLAYYYDTVKTSIWRLPPLTCYYHKDLRPDRFAGTALTGVQSYIGDGIPGLKGSVVFTDLARKQEDKSQSPTRGVLAYARAGMDCKLNDYSIIDTNYDFGAGAAFYVSLGTNLEQTSLFLGVYGSVNVADYNQGTVFEIVP